MSTELSEFDVVIVGAGSAGCLLANRLSANSSLREITKRTGLSRNTIREWLRKPEEVQAARPTYSMKDAACKLTAFHETLKQALQADAHRTKHNRRTVKALFAQIKADRYLGGYSQLTAFIRRWRGSEGKGRQGAPRLCAIDVRSGRRLPV